VPWCDLGLKSCAFQPNEAPPIVAYKPGPGFPVTRVAAVFSIACGAVLELGIDHDADKGYPGSPAIGLA
jgi:hypothetical protein